MKLNICTERHLTPAESRMRSKIIDELKAASSWWLGEEETCLRYVTETIRAKASEQRIVAQNYAIGIFVGCRLERPMELIAAIWFRADKKS